jgi:aspartate-semialdehyde dehydrogenase
MKIAVVGATGLVGREMVRVLEERDLPFDELIPVATRKSAGTPVLFKGKEFFVTDHATAISERPRFALFSAGAETSLEWAPRYAEAGITVIDNSSAWRMDRDVPLVVPEINGNILTRSHRIISNPNCSTIQLVMVTGPLHRRYGISRMVISTYQSVSGSGAKAVRQLENERKGVEGEKAYPYPIDLNLFPHGGKFLPDGYTTEEIKLVNETRKILDDPSIRITATIVRVPVFTGHSESVNLEFLNTFTLEEVRSVLSSSPGVSLQDDVFNNIYPMPLYCRGSDYVFVGRIRRDESRENSLNLFIVADNLRKGAATNAVQIAGQLLQVR